MTAFSQTSPNTVEEMEVFRFEADDTTYVMFYADDYKKLLEIGRENVLLKDIKDSLTISYNALVGSIDMFVMEYEAFVSYIDTMKIVANDLQKSFKEYTDATETKLEKAVRKWYRWRSVGLTSIGFNFIQVGALITTIKVLK